MPANEPSAQLNAIQVGACESIYSYVKNRYFERDISVSYVDIRMAMKGPSPIQLSVQPFQKPRKPSFLATCFVIYHTPTLGASIALVAVM